MSFRDLKKGDKVTRMLAGVIPMNMTVAVIEGDVVKCTADGASLTCTWWFDSETGAEIDHELGWGPLYGVTGSYLKKKPEAGPAAPESASSSSDKPRDPDPVAGPA